MNTSIHLFIFIDYTTVRHAYSTSPKSFIIFRPPPKAKSLIIFLMQRKKDPGHPFIGHPYTSSSSSSEWTDDQPTELIAAGGPLMRHRRRRLPTRLTSKLRGGFSLGYHDLYDERVRRSTLRRSDLSFKRRADAALEGTPTYLTLTVDASRASRRSYATTHLATTPLRPPAVTQQ